jgi:predicted RNase H-like HicB family nuclease
VKNRQREHRMLPYHLHKGVTGEYVGWLAEIPEVIVHSSTKEGIKKSLYQAMDAYFSAFPEEHDKALELEQIELISKKSHK